MQSYSITSILLLLLGQFAYSQTIVYKLTEFYAGADFDCYEYLIQQDINRYDSLLSQNLPAFDTIPHLPVRPGHVDLSEHNKVFALAVTLANTNKYNDGDNIYDYLIIDSTRTFILILLDDRDKVIGFTDTIEPGSYVDLTDDFYFPDQKRRRRLQQFVKSINRQNPELILYCDALFGRLMYVKDGKIYVYNDHTGKSKELNESVGELSIRAIRRLHHISLPPTGVMEGYTRLRHRFTGHTPPDEVRMCPRLVE